ncbi:MAG: leucine-rich repeat domain-containing protein, partial [Muribaculaceae bacterium]|nr:leucine-rich repeat domain-containing protein [Muribaculaceae bacterium]
MNRLIFILSLFCCALSHSLAANYEDDTFKYAYNKSQKFARIEVIKKKTLKTLDIPSKVTINGVSYPITQIGAYAFSDMEKLTSVTIPSSVTEIREGAFCNCFELRSVNIPSKVTVIGNDCFSMCLKLSEVTLPKNLTEIGEGAFTWCGSLEMINWPSTLKKIGKYAFNCAKLPKYVELPQNCID